MPSFSYLHPRNNEELFKILDQKKGQKFRLLAGGTDILPALRNESLKIDFLIDLSSICERHILVDQNDGLIRIGSLATFNDIAENQDIKRYFPALAEAALAVGAVQTRGLATIGGNICSAVPSCESGASLLIFGAEVVLRSKHGERRLAIEDFFIGPRKTVCSENEYLVELLIPLPKDGIKTNFLKYGRRKALTLPIVNGAASLRITSGCIDHCRIALGAVAPTPRRAYRAEAFLCGKKPKEELFVEASVTALEEMSPIDDLRASAFYRKELGSVLVHRVLINCLDTDRML